MDFSLTQKQQLLIETATAFCREQLTYDDLLERDKNEVFSQKLWAKCGNFGLQGLMVDEAAGGKGLDGLETIVVLETLGKECADEGLLFAVNAHLLSIAYPINKYGFSHQKQALLKDLVSGKKIGAHCITEQGGGSDVFNMNTTATKNSAGFTITGQKNFVTNAPVADLLLIYAVTDAEKGVLGGITPFLIERSRIGTGVGPNISKMGLRTCSMGHVWLSDVPVERSDMLGEEGGGFKIFSDIINWERIGMSAMLMGIISRVIGETHQFIKANGLQRHQAVTHMLAANIAKLNATKALVYKAAWSINNNPAEVTSLAASAKLLASELYKQMALDAVQIRGAHGYIVGNMVEMHVRNSVASTLYSGTSEIQKNILFEWSK